MRPALHKEITFKVLVSQGFSEEEAAEVAEENVKFDKLPLFKPWAHFKIAGADFFNSIFLWLALVRKSKKYLGWTLHSAQDSVSHGWILPFLHNLRKGIDEFSQDEQGRRKKQQAFESTQRIAQKFKNKLKV